jgi:predicted CoA-binding protein
MSIGPREDAMTESSSASGAAGKSDAEGKRSGGADDPITEILKSSRTIAVVGLSSRKFRPSYGVSQYMQAAGYRIIPVNPGETVVLGEKAYARLEDVPERVDIVDIFRRPEYVPDIVESAIKIGARAIWMQEGVIHDDAAERARAAGLIAVQDACILKEHAKRFRIKDV